MFFGAYVDDNNGLGGATAEQIATADVMQDLLLAFMEDPQHGPEAAGWPAFDPNADGGGTILRFGAGGRPVQKVHANDLDGICTGHGTWDPFPT